MLTRFCLQRASSPYGCFLGHAGMVTDMNLSSDIQSDLVKFTENTELKLDTDLTVQVCKQ